MALTNIDGTFSAMDNRCPHQGGPLGEGSIETGNDGQCWLRCPWHGWDFDPTTGLPPGGHEDTGQQMFPVDVRAVDLLGELNGENPVVPDPRSILGVTSNACALYLCF